MLWKIRQKLSILVYEHGCFSLQSAGLDKSLTYSSVQDPTNKHLIEINFYFNPVPHNLWEWQKRHTQPVCTRTGWSSLAELFEAVVAHSLRLLGGCKECYIVGALLAVDFPTKQGRNSWNSVSIPRGQHNLPTVTAVMLEASNMRERERKRERDSTNHQTTRWMAYESASLTFLLFRVNFFLHSLHASTSLSFSQ